MTKGQKLLALAGLGGLAYLLTRGLSSAGSNALDRLDEGEFDPTRCQDEPDYERVTDGYLDGTYQSDWYSQSNIVQVPNAEDMLYWGMPPGVGNPGAPTYSQGDGLQYRAQMWRPASRIALGSLRKGDIVRAGLFLTDSWKKGQSTGCYPQSYEVKWKGINDRLESEASGLDIGSQIGLALVGLAAPIFAGGAQASDSSFGFGRGAAEDRAAKVDLANVKSPTGDVGLSKAIAFTAPLRPIPSGQILASNTLKVSGSEAVGCLGNLFYGLYRRYSDGYSSFDLGDRGGIADMGGNVYIQLGYAYPWWSIEMGGNRSFRDRVYIRARMLRAIDMLQAVLFPSETAYGTQVGTLVDDGTGTLIPGYEYDRLTWAYDSPRFGRIAGSIFPGLPEDKPLISTSRVHVDGYIPDLHAPAATVTPENKLAVAAVVAATPPPAPSATVSGGAARRFIR